MQLLEYILRYLYDKSGCKDEVRIDLIRGHTQLTNAKSIHGSGTKQRMVSILIYAQPDDRFDLLTLEICINARSKNGKLAELPPANPSKGSKRDRNGRR